MLSDEEMKAIQYLNKYCDTDLLYEQRHYNYIKMIIRLVGKQSKEIERINEILIWKQKHEEQLQKEIEELKEKNEYLPSWVSKKYVSKDKIKAKIEELEKEKNIPQEMDFKAFYRIKDLKNIEIAVFQSLLEKEFPTTITKEELEKRWKE